MLIIQHYRCAYGKEARHAEFAKYRNQAPLVARIPTVSTDAEIIVHKRGHHWIGGPSMSDRQEKSVDFMEPHVQVNRYEDFAFKFRDDVLHATFNHSADRHGLPIRKAFTSRHPLFKLKQGETLQFRINGRNSDHSNRWQYLHHVINFAYGEFDSLIFMHTEFTRIIDLEASLL